MAQQLLDTPHARLNMVAAKAGEAFDSALHITIHIIEDGSRTGMQPNI
jgi:hypothetical protein